MALHGRGVGLALALVGLGVLSVTGCGRTPASTGLARAGAMDSAAQSPPTPSDPSNPLIGVWNLSGYSPNANMPGVGCSFSDLTFTAKQVTEVSAAGSSTIDFSYAPAGAKVYVMTDAGVSNAVAYKLLDPVTMQIDALLLCTYRRVG
jgi:hypothetical protein